MDRDSETKSTRRRLSYLSESPSSSPTLMLLVLFATIGAIYYGIFIFNPANRGDIVPYLLVLLAEVFLLFQAMIAMWTVLSAGKSPRTFGFHDAQEHIFSDRGSKVLFRALAAGGDLEKTAKTLPLYMHQKQAKVDVFITTFGEPLDVISKTVVAARELIGAHETYILDDGKSNDVKKLAAKLKVKYIRRPDNEGAKAGNINHALSVTSGEFFVVFDADFVPLPGFIYETLPFFEDDRIAFVQTPQHYGNKKNLISIGAGFMQMLFYRLIQTGKNRFNAAFCVGTNVIFRRTAVEAVGGIYDKSKSEDIWTSILLHEEGYKSVYIPDVLAVGSTPDTIKSYSKQQLRWATGGFQILLRHNPLLVKNLTIDQKVQYLGTTSYYLYGFAVMGLLLLPPLHIFFNLSPVNLSISLGSWFVYYLGFYGMQVFLAFYTMASFRLETIVLGTVSAPIYVRAFFNALLGKEEAWQATGNKDGYDSPFNYIFPQLFIFLGLVFTSLVGIWKTYYYQDVSLSLFWCLLNTVVFGIFIVIALREEKRIRVDVVKTKQDTVRVLKKKEVVPNEI
jgi:cellulose synthase (UDP-forming)